MSNADGSNRNGGYSIPNPVIERLRVPNPASLPFWAACVEGDILRRVREYDRPSRSMKAELWFCDWGRFENSLEETKRLAGKRCMYILSHDSYLGFLEVAGL